MYDTGKVLGQSPSALPGLIPAMFFPAAESTGFVQAKYWLQWSRKTRLKGGRIRFFLKIR